MKITSIYTLLIFAINSCIVIITSRILFAYKDIVGGYCVFGMGILGLFMVIFQIYNNKKGVIKI